MSLQATAIQTLATGTALWLAGLGALAVGGDIGLVSWLLLMLAAFAVGLLTAARSLRAGTRLTVLLVPAGVVLSLLSAITVLVALSM